MTELKKSNSNPLDDHPDNREDAKSMEETQIHEMGNDQLNRALSQRHLVRDHIFISKNQRAN